MILVSNHMFFGVKESDEHIIKNLRPFLTVSDNINEIVVYENVELRKISHILITHHYDGLYVIRRNDRF